MRLRLTKAADTLIDLLLRETLRLFGPRQTQNYADILQGGLNLIAENPFRPSSLARDELGAGVRSLNLELVERRRRSAAHVVFDKVVTPQQGSAEIVVSGVLHERMEPRRRLSAGLRDLDTGGSAT